MIRPLALARITDTTMRTFKTLTALTLVAGSLACFTYTALGYGIIGLCLGSSLSSLGYAVLPAYRGTDE